MGLSILRRNGKEAPFLICDTCGQPIEKLDLAIATFPPIYEDVVARGFHKTLRAHFSTKIERKANARGVEKQSLPATYN